MRIFILLALLGSALAVPGPINRIVGGTETTIEEYPYMVNMEFGWWGINFLQACGGTLITENAVLTAAHCFNLGTSTAWWRMRLGSSNRFSGGVTHSVMQIILHPQYNRPVLDNDIAILRLVIPATLSDTIGLGRIAGPNTVLADGTSITAVGWGAISSGGPASPQLLHVALDVINQELCAERYAYLKTLPGFQNWPDISPGMLCAGILDVGGKDACQGDSGGPVSYLGRDDGHVVAGVTSWGYRCADPFYPGVLARVSFYSDWIVATAQF